MYYKTYTRGALAYKSTYLNKMDRYAVKAAGISFTSKDIQKALLETYSSSLLDNFQT